MNNKKFWNIFAVVTLLIALLGVGMSVFTYSQRVTPTITPEGVARMSKLDIVQLDGTVAASIDNDGNVIASGTISTAGIGVQNDAEVEGDLFVDSIKESTLGAGVVVGNDVEVTGTIKLDGVQDSSGNSGTSGQTLSSTGAGTDWVDVGTLAESGFVAYGQFSDSGDQTFALADAPQSIVFDTNDEVQGITHSTTTATEIFTITQGGVYTLIAQPQVASGPGDSGKYRMWLQLDAGAGFTDVLNSNVELTLSSSDEDVIPLVATMALSQGDLIRIRAVVDDTGLFLDAQSPAGEPGVPSIIYTMFNNIGSQTVLSDADGDTKIEVERTTDGDTIYLKTLGVDALSIASDGDVEITGTVDVVYEIQIGTFLNLTVQTEISVTNGAVFTPTGTYQLIAAAGEVTPTLSTTGFTIGDRVELHNTEVAVINIENTGTTQILKDDYPMDQYDVLGLRWDGSAWVELYRTGPRA